MLSRKISAQSNSKRKARTRTLIQLGGLLKLSGLLERCQIEEGQDLQLEMEHKDKAAMLLGLLIECCEGISDATEEQAHYWQSLGIRALKMHQAKKYS